jgi:hypothetical protein
MMGIPNVFKGKSRLFLKIQLKDTLLWVHLGITSLKDSVKTLRSMGTWNLFQDPGAKALVFSRPAVNLWVHSLIDTA